jgi:hypothetical protein
VVEAKVALAAAGVGMADDEAAAPAADPAEVSLVESATDSTPPGKTPCCEAAWLRAPNCTHNPPRTVVMRLFLCFVKCDLRLVCLPCFKGARAARAAHGARGAVGRCASRRFPRRRPRRGLRARSRRLRRSALPGARPRGRREAK